MPPPEREKERCPQCGGGVVPLWQPVFEGDRDGRTWRGVGATRESHTDRPCRHPWHDLDHHDSAPDPS